VGDPGDQRRDAYRDAVTAVRAAAAGKSRDEVRVMLDGEMRARGVEAPSEPVMEALVSNILGKRLRAAAEVLGIFRPLLDLFRSFSDAMPQYRAGRSVMYLVPDRYDLPFKVIVDPGAAQWLRDGGREFARMPDPGQRIDVWLDSLGRPSEGAPIRIHVRESLAGVLSSEYGRTFWAEIEKARLNGYALMTSGFRRVAADGALGFYVYRPLLQRSNCRVLSADQNSPRSGAVATHFLRRRAGRYRSMSVPDERPNLLMLRSRRVSAMQNWDFCAHTLRPGALSESRP
jgi:hypothetical protein